MSTGYCGPGRRPTVDTSGSFELTRPPRGRNFSELSGRRPAKGARCLPTTAAYAARVIAARTGISQADAEQRVNQTIAQAKEAADRARRAAAKFSLWIAISLLAGAFSASLAAAEGGKLRNEPLVRRGR